MSTPLDERPDNEDGISQEASEWADSLPLHHAPASELTSLVEGASAIESGRALAHLRRCVPCRHVLAMRIEDVVLDDARPELLSRLLGHDDPAVREAAAYAAAAIAQAAPEDADQTIASLVASLRDTVISVRAAAAAGLKNLGDSAKDAAATVVSEWFSPRFDALTINGGLAENTASTEAPVFKIERGDQLEFSVREKDDDSLAIRVAVRNPGLSGMGVTLSSGAWSRSWPLTPVPRNEGDDPEMAFVEAMIVLEPSLRRRLGTNSILKGRIVALSGAS